MTIAFRHESKDRQSNMVIKYFQQIHARTRIYASEPKP